MPKFATQTSVSVEKSRAEIESILSKYGAREFGYFSGEKQAVIVFSTKTRQVQFKIPLPSRDAFRVTPSRRRVRSADSQHQAWEQACRQRWRALVLAIKAKLEAVECGISTFEQEFLAHIIDPATGKTVGEELTPMIEERYSNPGLTHRPLALPSPD